MEAHFSQPSSRSPSPNPRLEQYRALLAAHSNELPVLAHVKRLIERFQGDARFRQRLLAGPSEARRAASEHGIAIDPHGALPLFMPEHQQEVQNQAARLWPLAELWNDFDASLDELRLSIRHASDCAEVNPRFDAWHRRQVQRCNGEFWPIPDAGYPILAFELSKGCSVGCWFCGVSAERLGGIFHYTPENARSWREVLEVALDLFGAAAQTGFCYYATDPADNPDYAAFLEDYYWATGELPATSTAAPLRDLTSTRRVLALHKAFGYIPNRFSILSLKMLDRVHAAFTAEELSGVRLAMHNPEGLTPRIYAGRARRRAPDARSMHNQTIACVAGFVTNMVEGTVRLVSPRRASERWPLGERVYERRGFATAGEFRNAVEDMIDRHMPLSVGGGDQVRFRADLVYSPTDDGFELRSAGGRVALGGFEARLLGDLIHRGDKGAGEIEAVTAAAGADIFVTADLIQQLFDRGLIDEDPVQERIHDKLACETECRRHLT